MGVPLAEERENMKERINGVFSIIPNQSKNKRTRNV